MLVDRNPHLFTPPKKGTRTVVKDGANGWNINTFDGEKWHTINLPDLTLLEI